jgi:Ca2+-binding RTX toxin-like protein
MKITSTEDLTIGSPTHKSAAVLNGWLPESAAPHALAHDAIASFAPGFGLLNVFAGDPAVPLVIGRSSAGVIDINGGAVQVFGGTPSLANTQGIVVVGSAGNDVITLDETRGTLPAALMFGGAGNDTLSAGSGNDQLFGQAGNDTLDGKAGDDLLFGGDGNDLLKGGTGSDRLFGEAGDDRFVWNRGDGTDTVDGGTGSDSLEVNGGNGADNLTVVPDGVHVHVQGEGATAFDIDTTRVESITVAGNGGDDVITARNGLATLVQLTLDGGAGNDTVNGGDGNDLLIGGDGDDSVFGGRGSDTVRLGAGDDLFVWNPGDGSDTVDGGTGTDRLLFNGANVAEHFELSSTGTSHLLLTRDIGGVSMETRGIERVDLATFGGSDTVVVQDLGATAVTDLRLDLGLAGGTADALADHVELHGGASGEQIAVAGDAGAVQVSGMHAAVTLSHLDSFDTLTVVGGDGQDTLNGAQLAVGTVLLTLDGGSGDDSLVGSQGNDLLLGGDGNDTVSGGAGSDVIEGGAGNDTLLFDASNADEVISLIGNGGRASLVHQFSLQPGDALEDMDDIEHLRIAAHGGADTVIVGDLHGTDLAGVEVDLSGVDGGDGDADTVLTSGNSGAESIAVTSAGGVTTVTGLGAEVHISGADPGVDQLLVLGLGGDDRIDASGMEAAGLRLTVNGGDGDDQILGSAGDDMVIGGRGSDQASMGAGNDTFIWNPGDGSDTIDGGAGYDTLQFNGANVAEVMELSADGEAARFTRDVGQVSMALNGVEQVNLVTFAGIDAVTVHDLSGTDVQQVHIDLGTLGGGGDGGADQVFIEGTAGDDVIRLSMQDGALVIDGLPAQIVIDHFELNDQIHILGLGGDDVIEGSLLPAGGPALVFDGGDGNDVLLGGDGDDVLLGGQGDDVLIGGAGFNTLDGGPGDNVLIA